MTALKELIEIIKDKRKESDIANAILRVIQDKAEKLLDKEQQQIAKAYDLGVEAMHQRGGVVSRALCDWDEIKKEF